MSALKYWIWLATRRRLPARQTLRVLEQFSTPEGAYAADPAEYKLVEGLSAVSAASFSDKSLDRAEEILAACDHQGIRVLTIQDAEYPYCLRQIEDPPCVLYVKGKLPAFDDEAAIAMVGARGATPYGLQMAAGMGMEMARCGALIVSGSARGVDSAALRGALRGGGCVVSVLGNGPDVVYPAQNRDLYADVAAVGALISEYPPGTTPAPEHFPVRNRILSGLSLGVMVVEGTERSGSLITARLALDQGRDVFAVPGNVDAPMSGGPNLLIRRGEAKLVTKAWDVLEEYAPYWPHKITQGAALAPERAAERLEQLPGVSADEAPAPPEQTKKVIDKGERRTYIDWKEHRDTFTDDQRDVLLALSDGPLPVNELIERTQLAARRVLSALTLLQVGGFVAEGPGKRFTSSVLLRMD